MHLRHTGPARAILASVIVAALAAGQPTAAQEQQPQPNPNCTPLGNQLPLGQAVSDHDTQRPIWCYTLDTGAQPSRDSGPNDWVDDFGQSGLVRFADRDLDYRVFNLDQSERGVPRIKIGSFVESGYWQVDMADTSQFRLSGGTLHSPNRAFQFEGDPPRLVIEFDAAPGLWNTGGADVFYEVDISPAPAPTGTIVDGLYGYGTFGRAGAIGCRLQVESIGGVRQGESVCAQYDNSNRDAGGTAIGGGPNGPPGRVWETQGLGDRYIATTNQQRNPAGYWRQCAAGEDDELCRDRFRLELTRDSLLLYVNGFLQREIRGLYSSSPNPDAKFTGRDNRVPDSWFGPAGVHVYLTDWINSGQHQVERFKWGHVAVNPHDDAGAITPPGVSESFCLGEPRNTCAEDEEPAPTRTPAPALTPTPQPTARVESTGTPVRLPTETPTAQPGATQTPTPVATPQPTDCRVLGVLVVDRDGHLRLVNPADPTACQ